MKHLLVSTIVLAGLGMLGLMVMSFKGNLATTGGSVLEDAPLASDASPVDQDPLVNDAPLPKSVSMLNDAPLAEDKPGMSYGPIVVLELFTSQGCSSCPPADALLDKVKNTHPEKVFALSYHVDYWNYIGWEDPFSNPRFTEKQTKYNLKLKSRSNYTPEIVVNGQAHFVGSDEAQLQKAIAKYSAIETPHQVSLSDVSTDGKNVRFSYGFAGPVQGAKLRAVLVLDRQTTQVKRGENRNRTLVNSNVVTAEKSIAIEGTGQERAVRDGAEEYKTEKGQSFIAIPEIVFPDDAISLVLLAENENLDITGAAKAKVNR